MVLHRRLTVSYRRKYVGLFDFVFFGVLGSNAEANLRLDLEAEHFLRCIFYPLMSIRPLTLRMVNKERG